MKKIARISVYFLLLLGAWLSLAWLAANFLIVEKPSAKADVIVVLSGAVTFHERVEKAAELYHRGVSKKIILTNDFQKTGWNAEQQRNIPYYELAESRLIELDVTKSDIEVLPEYVGGTVYEARLVKTVAEERNYESVLIVTSAYHSRRALWIFEKVFGPDSRTKLGIESPPPGNETPSRLLWWLSSRGWIAVGGEYVKFIYYWTKY